jgi:hypothetical protein
MIVPFRTHALLSIFIILVSVSAALAQRDGSKECGICGPHHAEIHCPVGQHANCWCKWSIICGDATCTCDPDGPSGARLPPPKNCSSPPFDYACGGAGIVSWPFPGCSTNCAAGNEGVCSPAICEVNHFSPPNCNSCILIGGAALTGQQSTTQSSSQAAQHPMGALGEKPGVRVPEK